MEDTGQGNLQEKKISQFVQEAGTALKCGTREFRIVVHECLFGYDSFIAARYGGNL